MPFASIGVDGGLNPPDSGGLGSFWFHLLLRSSWFWFPATAASPLAAVFADARRGAGRYKVPRPSGPYKTEARLKGVATRRASFNTRHGEPRRLLGAVSRAVPPLVQSSMAISRRRGQPSSVHLRLLQGVGRGLHAV